MTAVLKAACCAVMLIAMAADRQGPIPRDGFLNRETTQFPRGLHFGKRFGKNGLTSPPEGRYLIISTQDRPKIVIQLLDLSDRLVNGPVSEAVLAMVDSLRHNPTDGVDLVRNARLLSERLIEAAAQLEFALRVIDVGGPGSPSVATELRQRQLESASPRRSSPLLERLIRDVSADVNAVKQEPPKPEIDDEDENDDLGGVERGGELRALLATLPDFRQIAHVAETLRGRYPEVQRVPRQKSRGNAALLVLDKFARSRALSLGDLVFAFRTMNVINPEMSDPDARRLVGWEINELRRRKWPVQRIPGVGFRMLDSGGTAM